jgi:hypothetical protein
VSGLTRGLFVSTRDTVAWDTPASRARSRLVGGRPVAAMDLLPSSSVWQRVSRFAVDLSHRAVYTYS